MAKAPQQEKVSFRTRMKQIGMVFSYTAKRDKWFIPLVVGAAPIPIALTVLAVAMWGWIWIVIGIMVTILAVLIVLNLRSNTAMMNEAEGQLGAAVGIAKSMRGQWFVQETVSATTQMDMVHLVVGRPGVILIGEGQPQRVRTLIGQEKKRLTKIIGTAPLFDYVIGNGEGELSIRKMRLTFARLPKTLKARDVIALDKRLKALAARPQIPKGAIPKNMRPPKGAFRGMRGR
jgi:hypothetical protein